MTAPARSRLPRGAWPLAFLIVAAWTGPGCRADTYAFLVGVSDYENKAELKPLRFSCDDMISFAGVLRNSGVPARNIVVMHDRQSNARFKPSRAKVLKEFHLLLATLEPEDSLIVALAGHGVQLGAEGNSYFLPADAELKDPATLINVKILYEEMERSQAGRKLLLVDACRNDPEADNARGAGVTLQPPRRLVADPPPRGIAALFSCNSEQRSFEDPALRHGIFFYQVIKAWEGAADLDRNGLVTLEELESFVRRETKTHARDALSAIQTPVFRADRLTANGWVVATPTAPRPEPERPDLGELLDRGDALRRQGDNASAEREYARALRVDSNSPRAHLALGKIYHARGQIAQAVREYSEAIRNAPNDAAAHLSRAVAHGAVGDLQAALADYEQAIRIDPNLAVAYVGQGAILARLNRPDEAIAACTRAIALDARNAKAYYNRGVAREAKDDRAGAAQDFQKASRLDPRLKNP
jgi:tetratricopeptide (TPR) repeat protein